MGQPRPIYPSMAIAPHEVITNNLKKHQLSWPILWYTGPQATISSVSFEINSRNQINKPIDATSAVVRLISSNIYRINYQANPHVLDVLKGAAAPIYIQSAASDKYSFSYQYITTVRSNFNTIDVDYLWNV